jgi:hypothetical protein
MHCIYKNQIGTYYTAIFDNENNDELIFGKDIKDVFLFDGRVHISFVYNSPSNAYLQVDGIEIFKFNKSNFDYETTLYLSEIAYFLNKLETGSFSTFKSNYLNDVKYLYAELIKIKDIYTTDALPTFENADDQKIKPIFNTINNFKRKLLLLLGVIYQMNTH